MKLYFGNTITVLTTITILLLIIFIGYSVLNRENIQFWGRRNLILLIFGLLVCCFAAARDGLDKTIQYNIDGSCVPGVFSLVSVPTLVGCAGAAIIVIAAVAVPFAKSQHAREMLFYAMSCGVILKIITIEIARIILR